MKKQRVRLLTRPYVIGIDPGISGGLALVDALGRAQCWPMPRTPRDIWLWSGDVAQPDLVVLEKVHGFPTDSPRAITTFMKNAGALDMLLAAREWRTHRVTPRDWQKRLGVPQKPKGWNKTRWKNELKRLAQDKFPGLHITLNTADALLIGEAGRQILIAEGR